MRIRVGGGLTRGQILIAGILGVLGGVYIWKPVFEAQRQKGQEGPAQDSASDSGKNNDAELLKD